MSDGDVRCLTETGPVKTTTSPVPTASGPQTTNSEVLTSQTTEDMRTSERTGRRPENPGAENTPSLDTVTQPPATAPAGDVGGDTARQSGSAAVPVAVALTFLCLLVALVAFLVWRRKHQSSPDGYVADFPVFHRLIATFDPLYMLVTILDIFNAFSRNNDILPSFSQDWRKGDLFARR